MRIGIDVDGVLTNYEKFQLEKGKEYFRDFDTSTFDFTEYDVEQIFNCTHKERNKFWTKYIFQYCLTQPMTRDASLVINQLHNEGNEIYIITGRVHTKEKGITGSLFREMLTRWLKKNEIPYEKIIYCDEKGSEVDKYNACVDNKIDVMIDDKKENINELSKITRVLCYDSLYNQECKGDNITRVHNFNEVYQAIKQIEAQQNIALVNMADIENLAMDDKIEYLKKAREYYSSLPYDDSRIEKEEKIYKMLTKYGKPLFDKVFTPKVFNREFVPDGNGIIFASNHNNYYDQFPIISALGDDIPVHFLTATKMLKMKRGKLYSKTGVISVDRDDKNDRKTANDEMKKILLNGGNVGIFPEGRTNKHEKFLLPFHTGAVSLAQVTGCPIVPIAVNDNYRKDESLCVRFGEPMYVKYSDDINEKNELLMEKIGTLIYENMDYNKSEETSKEQKVMKKTR